MKPNMLPTVPYARLQSLRIRINDQCNMKCRHCARPAPKKGAVFNFSRFRSKLIEDLHQLDTKEVAITGGEPTLELNLVCAIGRHLIDAGIASILFTNAYNLNSEELDRMLDAGIFTMHVSLDGFGPTHDWHRNTPGAFARTLANIETASSMGFQVLVRMTLTRVNIAEMKQVADSAHNAGAAIFKIRPVVPSGRASHELCPSAEQVAEVVKSAIAMSKYRQITFGSSCFEFLQGTTPSTQPGCFSKHLHVDALGNLVPCGYIKLPLGNLVTHRLTEVFYGARMNALRTLNVPDTCSSCGHLSNCLGGCRACAVGWGLRSDEADLYCPLSVSSARKPYVSGSAGKYSIRCRDGFIELQSASKPGLVILDPRRKSSRLIEQQEDVVVLDRDGIWSKKHQLQTPLGASNVNRKRAVDIINYDFCSIQLINRDESLISGGVYQSPIAVIEFDGFRFCYIGGLTRSLSHDEISALMPVDVLLCLYDDAHTCAFNNAKTMDMMKLLGAQILIPVPSKEDMASLIALHLGENVKKFIDTPANVDVNNLPREREIWLFSGHTTVQPRKMRD